jgi:thiaminase (transcriptional activator TenA)
MAGLSQHLFRLGRANLGRQLAHPTVRGIATGDLEPARFRAWLVQDYLFLLDYVRLFALAAARAADTDTLGRLVDLAHSTFHQELSLHRGYAAEFGLGEADLDQAEKSPVCAAYTDFLLRTATTADFAEVLAALLPCMWGYSELGRALAAAGLPSLATGAGSRPTPTRSSPPWPPGARPCLTGRPMGSRRPAWPPASGRS